MTPFPLRLAARPDAMPRPNARVTSVSKLAVLWLPVLATAVGYAAYSLYDPVQVARTKVLVLIALAVNGASLLVHLLRRGLPLPLLVGGTWLLAASLYVGLAPAVAIVLVAASALGLGSLLLDSKDGTDSLGALLVGLALMTAMAGWLLPFPIHQRGLYFTLALVIVAVRASAIGGLLATTGRSLLSATSASPVAAFIVINLVVGACDKRGKHELGDVIDHWCRWLFPIVYLSLLVVIGFVAFRVLS